SERRVSPEGCDAGIGGVGWLDDTRVIYAMACGGEPSHVYVASSLTTPGGPEELLRVDPHDEPTRDVFPAVRTPVFAYVVDRTVCEGGTCGVKPEVWVGETDGNHCRLSDGDPALTPTAGLRLGDHAPSFNGALDQVVFSRNVAGKPVGPDGHFDLMRVGFDLNALLRGQETCTTGATANLSNTLLALETYPDASGAAVVGSERFPDAAAGRGPAGSILYTSEVGDPPVRSLWLLDPGGNRIELTPGDTALGPARWVVDQYETGR
ncbi:MAG: hypothetical protein KC613_04295, partial [Myxococcales bacterium]|nr:hypothetical protein [Myxococcales bacterium]